MDNKTTIPNITHAASGHFPPSASAYAAPRTKKRSSMKKGAKVFLFTMLTVPILHWFVFWLYVNINSILLGFQMPDGTWTLSQFEQLFYELGASDSPIGLAIKNTLIYFINSLFIIMPLALFLSYFFYKKIYMYKTLRVVMYLPAIISAVAMTSAFSYLIEPGGPVYALLKIFGMQSVPEFLADSRYATWTIVFYCTWTGIGTGTLLFQGAMARIPTDVLEAARLDGCSAGVELFRIILPLIWPTISTQMILILTALFNSSGPILLFTNGNADTTTIAYWIFINVYNKSYNVVSAAGLFFTAIGVPVILAIRWAIEKIPAVEY